MAFQEGYSTARPPYFDGNDFAYWKGRMKYYLMNDIENWFSIVDGFEEPKDASGALLPTKDWTKEICKKAQANAKATTTLQCGLSKEQLSKVGPFDSAKELWEKLSELNEGSSESRRAKKDLLVSQLQSFTMKTNETVSQMHGRFKIIVNGLHDIGEKLDNRDMVRYALQGFPRNNLWTSMVDAFKLSRDLSTAKLDDLFCEFEIHEQANLTSKEKGIALFVEKKEKKKKKEKEILSESEEDSSDSDEEMSPKEMTHYVKKMMGKSRRFTRRNVKKMFKSSSLGKSENSDYNPNVTCYECNRKGHIKPNCPRIKKKEDFKKKDKKKKEVMVAQATWDDSNSESSDDEECHITRHMALTARENDDDTSSEEGNSTDNESSSSEEGSSSDNESSSSEEEVMDKVKQRLIYRTIAYLKNALDKSKSKVKALKEELKVSRSKTCDHDDLNTENEKLKDEIANLKKCLENFTLGSKGLNMVLNNQRALYNKAGIGYKPKEFSYISLVGRQRSRYHITKGNTKLAWVPKKYLGNVSESSFWIPKSEVFIISK